VDIIPLDAFDYHLVLDNRLEPSLVFFSSPACGACKRLKEVLRGGRLSPQGLVCREVQADQSQGLLEDLEVFHLPAIFLYAEGENLGPIETLLQLDAIDDAIQKMLIN